MKKALPILVTGFLILSGLGAFASNNAGINNDQLVVNSSNEFVEFSELVIEKENNELLDVSLVGSSTFLMEPGRPVLPKVVKTFELPFGVTDISVDVTPNNIMETEVSYEIRPASAHIPLVTLEQESKVQSIKSLKDEKLYTSTELYPSSWFSYSTGVGLNGDNERVTFVSVHVYPVRYIPAAGELFVAESCDIDVSYVDPGFDPLPVGVEYDLVIIAPGAFEGELERLVDHKNDFDVETFLMTTEDIYDRYDGVDKPEQIKYFIKDAIETYGVEYVLLVGGLKNIFWANPRDDYNQGSSAWHLPVRYNNLFDDPEHPLSEESIHDPGVITDLYYADIYEEGAEFSSWDPNGDGVFAGWRRPGVENDTGIDMYPDVRLGRLACRSVAEVKEVINKIINYESSPADPAWFKRVISISGDGFLDQEDLDFQWDTSGLDEGEYTIKAQSINPDEIAGPIDEIHVTIDRSVTTVLTFNHDDHLITDSYPYPPITEIVTVSNGNILGNTNYVEEPGDGIAYCNGFNGWANMNFTDGILHIRGKSYDPKPYGNLTDVNLWVENSEGETIFSDWRYNTEMYYEGEWVAGNKMLNGGGGALYYLDESFEKELLWASNGKMVNQEDLLESVSQGAGFVFMSGHGSPATWGDHFPGVPGNRQGGSFTGLRVTGITMYPPFVRFPLFPMDKLTNNDKLPIVLIGGCHNSQFNVSIIPSLLDVYNKRNTWCHGSLVPECFSWYLIKLEGRGAIATIGNTGLGYGILGKDTTIGGLDGGICIEFFKQYGQNGFEVLGDAYAETINTYLNTFDMEEDDHIKSVHQWVLLGDPTLMIGGYD